MQLLRSCPFFFDAASFRRFCFEPSYPCVLDRRQLVYCLWFPFIRSALETLNLHRSQVNMGSLFLILLKTLLSTLTTHRSLALENLALRQQLTILRGY